MKYISIIAGIALILAAVIPLGRYVFDIGQLSDYGLGFLAGKAILLIVGLALVFIGVRKFRG